MKKNLRQSKESILPKFQTLASQEAFEEAFERVADKDFETESKNPPILYYVTYMFIII